jgi:hypothetical protein
VFSRARLAEVWRLNTGAYQDVVDRRYYRHGGSIVPLDALSLAVPDGAPADAPGVRRLDEPLAVTCEATPGRRFVSIGLDANDRYLVEFVRDNRVVASLELGPIPAHRRDPGLATYTENLPVAATRDGFDTIVIAPLDGDETYAVGQLLLDGEPSTDGELQRRVVERDGTIPR